MYSIKLGSKTCEVVQVNLACAHAFEHGWVCRPTTSSRKALLDWLSRTLEHLQYKEMQAVAPPAEAPEPAWSQQTRPTNTGEAHLQCAHRQGWLNHNPVGLRQVAGLWPCEGVEAVAQGIKHMAHRAVLPEHLHDPCRPESVCESFCSRSRHVSGTRDPSRYIPKLWNTFEKHCPHFGTS